MTRNEHLQYYATQFASFCITQGFDLSGEEITAGSIGALGAGSTGKEGGRLKRIGNVVFFHLTPQGGAVDLEGRGGFSFIPVILSQRI